MDENKQVSASDHDGEEFEIIITRYDNITVPQALQRVENLLSEGGKRNAFFLNVNCLSIAYCDDTYRDILNKADLVLSDGVGLRLATWLFGGVMRDNCNGTDFSPRVMRLAAKEGYKVFFLGGEDGVARMAAERVGHSVPDLEIVGARSGIFSDDGPVVDEINASGADILFVAMGVPAQEKWIDRNRDRLDTRLCLGVGALLDYLSGIVPRAPLWMRKAQLEWFWRILLDPRRMAKRYLVDGLGFLVYLVYYRMRRGKKKCENRRS